MSKLEEAARECARLQALHRPGYRPRQTDQELIDAVLRAFPSMSEQEAVEGLRRWGGL